MILTNDTPNNTWKGLLKKCLKYPDFTVEPRGMEVREVINGTYTLLMPSYLTLDSRSINVPFMFAEAAWVISGSNRLDGITPYMKGYHHFSDDQVFLRGAYGPKIVDQLGYVVDTLCNDRDSRQAVLTTWRERPGPSKDIPCTVSMQFLIRDSFLNVIITMRSQDVVLGFTYDVFTFSMVAKAVQLLLRERGVRTNLGKLHVNAGSLHLYKKHYEQAEVWMKSRKTDSRIDNAVLQLSVVNSYLELITKLREGADNYGN